MEREDLKLKNVRTAHDFSEAIRVFHGTIRLLKKGPDFLKENSDFLEKHIKNMESCCDKLEAIYRKEYQ